MYFKNEEDLFKEVISTGLAPAVFSATALTEENDQSSTKRLHRFLRTWRCVMYETPFGNLLKLLAAEPGNFPDAVQRFNESILRQAKRTMISIVEAGIAGGEF
ncbi:MAG TPA: hypothetical protein VMC81_11680 [Rhodocyclaceae bacterium]|nr:hypothetical protein [Rhodocyclaceae bacterium]